MTPLRTPKTPIRPDSFPRAKNRDRCRRPALRSSRLPSLKTRTSPEKPSCWPQRKLTNVSSPACNRRVGVATTFFPPRFNGSSCRSSSHQPALFSAPLWPDPADEFHSGKRKIDSALRYATCNLERAAPQIRFGGPEKPAEAILKVQREEKIDLFSRRAMEERKRPCHPHFITGTSPASYFGGASLAIFCYTRSRKKTPTPLKAILGGSPRICPKMSRQGPACGTQSRRNEAAARQIIPLLPTFRPHLRRG